MAEQSGYSGKPLAQKLGIRAGTTVCAIDAPDEYLQLLGPSSESVQFARSASPKVDLVHLFTAQRSSLAQQLKRLRTMLRPDATIWVSWPKRASKVATDITEDVIREVALPLGLVDVKVCAVDEVWSGLKLVVRKNLRPA